MSPTYTGVVGQDAVLARFLARLAGRTKRNYEDCLRLWCGWLESRGTPLLEAGRQDVEEWIAARRADGISPRTAATNLSCLRGFYRWAMEECVIDVDPTMLVRRPVYGRSERPWLGREDTARLLEASKTWADGEFAAHIHLWTLSGLRPGEPRQLTVTDLSTYDGVTTISVPATKTPGRERLALPDATAALLIDAAGGRRQGILLINPRTGRAWTKCTERNRLDKLLVDAGLPRVTAYGLRTGFITHALAAGIDEREVMISARHNSSAQTARYDRLRDQVERAVGPRLAAWLHEPTSTTTLRQKTDDDGSHHE